MTGREYSGHAAKGQDADVVVRGDVATGEFIVFWMGEGRVLAGMNVNIWDATDAIAALVRSGARVDRAKLADPGVPLDDVQVPTPTGARS